MKTDRAHTKEAGTVLSGSRAFTLLELMIAVGLFGLVIAGSLGVYVMCQKFWQATTLNMQTSRMAEMALAKMIFGVGTNAGLREASSVTVYGYSVTGEHAVNNTAYAHCHYISTAYWVYSTNSPPAVADACLNMTCNFPTFNDGGSWRLVFSNQFSGVQCIEYNYPFQTLSLGTNSPQRIILATYVANAAVVPDSQGINIAITVARRIGALVSTNTASTYLRLRNSG